MLLQATPPSLMTLSYESLRIGLLGFGGPAGQIALMHNRFVDEKKWIDEENYLHALSYCMLLPGPEAQQLATYIGWRLHGVAGGLIAGLGFVIPGALIMLALSWAYIAAQTLTYFEPVLTGIRAVVLVVIAFAIARVAQKAIKNRLGWTIAIGSFVALLLFGIAFPLVILTALAIGWWCTGAPTQATKIMPSVKISDSLTTLALWLVVWLAPVALVWAIGPPVLAQIGGVFSGLSLVTFGGAYASTAWLTQYGVEEMGWLNAQNMLDGLGLVQTIPGPLVLINQFVGFIAGWGEGGIGLALAGAAMASWCTFAPSFLWIFAGAPYAEALRGNARVSGALAGVSAAVVGVMAYLGTWFGLQNLFTRHISLQLYQGATVALPDVTSFNVVMLLLVCVATGCQLLAKWGVLRTFGMSIAVSLGVWFITGQG